MGKIRKTHGAAVGALVAGTSVLLMGPIVVAAGAVGGGLAGATAAFGARTGAASKYLVVRSWMFLDIRMDVTKNSYHV
jgi:hypothetical protein